MPNFPLITAIYYRGLKNSFLKYRGLYRGLKKSISKYRDLLPRLNQTAVAVNLPLPLSDFCFQNTATATAVF